MRSALRKTINDIKSLKTQGARNVARAAVCALILEAKASKASDREAFLAGLEKAASMLEESRPTEPMMRNSLRTLMGKARGSGEGKVPLLKKEIAREGEGILDRMEEDMRRLFDHGAKLVPDGALVLTHCHSSTSTGALIEAKRAGKDFKVVCFETRPRYQGRKTASELTRAGIDTTLTVDGAMTLFMKKADMCLVGADSITSRGDLINKIGTSTLAHIARMHDVSFYCAAELSKFSPKTISGAREEIEERDPSEVWDKRPRKLRIRNPAFEATAAKYINGYVTEIGVIPPQSFFALASQRLGIKLYG